ncbi:hypothetical protein [Streptomyces sp. NPDC058953]|uniref:hypothetical protein n=1 Tax=unclassified Streptomyces TaxID=2593676 RepID=UPI00369CF8A7
MTIRTVWHAPTGQTQEDTRLATSALLTPIGPLASRGGVVPGGLHLAGLNAMQCTINTGRAIVQTTDRQGAYLVAVTEPETVTISPGDPNGMRRDKIVLEIQDSPYDQTGATQAVIKVVQGQVAPTAPVEPPTPAGALPLFTVTVPRNAASINWSTAVENRRYPTAALGGIVPTHGFDGLYTGQYRDNGARLERWNGTVWTAYPPAPAWRSWTPAWTSVSGLDPVFGNTTVDCRYVQQGTTVHFNVRIAFGTTTNFRTGSTNWRFSLPVTAAGTTHGIGFVELHQGADQSPATPADRAVGRLRLTSTNWFEVEVSSGKVRGGALSGVGIVDSAYPWTWKATDHIVGSGTYEAAAV